MLLLVVDVVVDVVMVDVVVVVVVVVDVGLVVVLGLERWQSHQSNMSPAVEGLAE